jgi:hypothetical protein
MVNKRGWLRIVEASVAILIILSVILVVAQKKSTLSENDLSETITPMLEEIAKNATLREQIIANNNVASENTLREFVSRRISNNGLGYNVRVCGYRDMCALGKYPEDAKGDIYSGSRIISSALNAPQLQPKKVEIFLWFKK